VGLYAVLARDACDFIDMVVEEENVETLKTLYLMLATPNPSTSPEDVELNRIGASIVSGNLTKRGVAVPEIPKPVKQSPPEQGSLF
jgi:hypothetical protein